MQISGKKTAFFEIIYLLLYVLQLHDSKQVIFCVIWAVHVIVLWIDEFTITRIYKFFIYNHTNVNLSWKITWTHHRVRRNFYNAFPERSGGAVILCNKCRVTKNFFWTDFFWIWYLFLEYFYFDKMIYFLKDNLDLRIHQFSKNEPKNLKDFCPMSYKNSQGQFLKIFRIIFWKLMIS